MAGPLLLVAGGSGVVPLWPCCAQRRATIDSGAGALLYSSRTIDDMIYRDELDGLPPSPTDRVCPHVTREQPPGLDRLRPTHRRAMLAGALERGGGADAEPLVSSAGRPAGRGRRECLVALGCRRRRFEPSASALHHDDRPAVIDDPLVLDANAVAGDLREFMGVEITTYVARCANCGNRGALGTLRAWTHGPGVVLRCVICSEVVIRWVRHPDGPRVDMGGAAFLQPG